jgi:hypothetical protein
LVLDDDVPDGEQLAAYRRIAITCSFNRPPLLPARVVLTVGNRATRWPYALPNDKMTKPYLTGTVDTCEQRLPTAS